MKFKDLFSLFNPLRCCICKEKVSGPPIFMAFRRYCPRCARFTLNFSHNVSTLFKAEDFMQPSDEGGNCDDY